MDYDWFYFQNGNLVLITLNSKVASFSSFQHSTTATNPNAIKIFASHNFRKFFNFSLQIFKNFKFSSPKILKLFWSQSSSLIETLETFHLATWQPIRKHFGLYKEKSINPKLSLSFIRLLSKSKIGTLKILILIISSKVTRSTIWISRSIKPAGAYCQLDILREGGAREQFGGI